MCTWVNVYACMCVILVSLLTSHCHTDNATNIVVFWLSINIQSQNFSLLFFSRSLTLLFSSAILQKVYVYQRLVLTFCILHLWSDAPGAITGPTCDHRRSPTSGSWLELKLHDCCFTSTEATLTETVKPTHHPTALCLHTHPCFILSKYMEDPPMFKQPTELAIHRHHVAIGLSQTMLLWYIGFGLKLSVSNFSFLSMIYSPEGFCSLMWFRIPGRSILQILL